MFGGLLYQPQMIRVNLMKTVIPFCVLFPLLYGLCLAIWPIVQILHNQDTGLFSLEAIKYTVLSSLNMAVPQIPEYVLDCLLYAVFRNSFTEKYVLGKGKYPTL